MNPIARMPNVAIAAAADQEVTRDSVESRTALAHAMSAKTPAAMRTKPMENRARKPS